MYKCSAWLVTIGVITSSMMFVTKLKRRSSCFNPSTSNTRISCSDKNLCLKYANGYAFHTIIVPKSKLAKITVTQSIFQILAKSCDVRIYTNSEFTKCHTIISMPLDDVLKFLEDANLTCIKIESFR